MKKINKTEKTKKLHWSVVVILIMCVSMLTGILSEIGYEASLKHKVKKEGYECDIRGVDPQNISSSPNKENPEISDVTIEFPQRYISKFQYKYETEETFSMPIQVDYVTGYGLIDTIAIKDDCSPNQEYSFVNVNQIVDKIVLQVPSEVTVSDFAVNNTMSMNKYRILFIAIVVFTILVLIKFRKQFSARIEYGFALIAMSVGICIIMLSSVQFLSWDEHIHFYKAYDFFQDGTIEWEEAEHYMFMKQENNDINPVASKEEKAAEINYLNNGTNDIDYTYEKEGNAVNTYSYFFMALAMQIGKWLKFDFYTIMLMGKIANLLLYCTVMFFAIKVIPVGKRFVALLGLMPTAMVQAAAFSYDSVVICFIFLGTALLIREFVNINDKINIWKLLLIALCFWAGSIAKLLYIPLILGFMFLPKEKFKNKHTKTILNIIVLGVLVLAVVAIYFIMFSNGSTGGDPRGGSTDLAKQMELVINHPFYYFTIFWKEFWKSLDYYVFGGGSLVNMAYTHNIVYPSSMMFLLIAVIFTEPRPIMSAEVKKSLKRYKIPAFIICAFIVGTIWTALYVDFTEVGCVKEIAGVQARYYIPLLLPLYLIFYTDKCQMKVDLKKYDTIIFGLMTIMWFLNIYRNYFLHFCM